MSLVKNAMTPIFLRPRFCLHVISYPMLYQPSTTTALQRPWHPSSITSKFCFSASICWATLHALHILLWRFDKQVGELFHSSCISIADWEFLTFDELACQYEQYFGTQWCTYCSMTKDFFLTKAHIIFTYSHSLNSIDELGISSSCLSCPFLSLPDTSSDKVILKHGEEEGGWNPLSRGSQASWTACWSMCDPSFLSMLRIWS